jgi:hypothetical protein
MMMACPPDGTHILSHADAAWKDGTFYDKASASARGENVLQEIRVNDCLPVFFERDSTRFSGAAAQFRHIPFPYRFGI